MKTTLRTATLASAGLGLALLAATSANALPINITNDGTQLVNDVSKGLLGNNNPQQSFNWLAGLGDFAGAGIVDGYNTITSSSLPDPVYTDFVDYDSTATAGAEHDLTGFAYAVVHYGKGQGGTGDGGGIVAFYLDGTGNYTFPADGAGPNGKGGISSLRLYKATSTNVPDGGITLVLLGVALTGLSLIRRPSARA